MEMSTALRLVQAALARNQAECQHPVEWGVRHGCGGCRAMVAFERIVHYVTEKESARSGTDR